MVRTIAEFVLLAIAIILGISWVQSCSDREAQKERAAQLEHDLAVATHKADSLGVVMVELDSIMATQDSAHEAEIEEARAENRELEAEGDSLLRVVLEQVPDSVREVVQQLHNSYQEQLSNKDRIIASLESQVAIRDTRILARDDLIEALKAERDEALSLARFWEKEAKPDVFARFKKNIGLIGTTALASATVTYILVSKP